VFSFEDRPDVVTIPNASELLRNTLHIWDIHRVQRLLFFTQTTATLGVNDRVNETLGVTTDALTNWGCQNKSKQNMHINNGHKMMN
jgi:hypothetical protein